MRYLLTLALFLLPLLTFSQPVSPQEQVKALIDTFFEGFHRGDSAQVANTLAPAIRILGVKDGQVVETPVSGFLEWIADPNRPGSITERLWNYDIRVDGPIASAWTDYSFFLDSALLHCGSNSFELAYLDDQWKIVQIIDSRRKEDCRIDSELPTRAIHQLLDDWHQAAAEADEATFFGSMAPNAVYLGTDSTELWLRDEMAEWAAPYFKRESAWAFTPSQRNITLSPSETVAWFNEALDTWMGSCRGSGVLRKYPEGWRLEQYNLTVTIPNEDMDQFIELIRNKE
jgi:hypothetical protein